MRIADVRVGRFDEALNDGVDKHLPTRYSMKGKTGGSVTRRTHGSGRGGNFCIHMLR